MIDQQTLLDSLSEFVAVVDRQGCHLFVHVPDDYPLDNHYYPETGKLFSDYFSPNEADSLLHALQKTLDTDEPSNFTLWYSDEFNKHFQIDFRFRKNSPDTVVVIARDNSQYQQAREQLTDQQQLYQDVIEQVDAVVWLFEVKSKKFSYVSNRISELTGETPEECLLRERPWVRWVHYEDLTTVESTMYKCIESGEPVSIEHRLIDKHGHLRWVVNRITPIGNPATERLIGVLVDITRQRKENLLQTVLYEIIGATQQSSTLENLLATYHTSLMRLMDVRNFYVAFYNSEDDTYSFPYFVDPVDDPVPINERIALPGSLTEYVRKSGEPLLCDSAKLHELQRNPNFHLTGVPAVHWLGVPLKSSRGVIGVMVTQTYTPGQEFTKEDQDVFAFVGANIANAIDRQRSESEREKLVTAVEAVAEGIAILDLMGRIEYINPALAKMMGTYTNALGSSYFSWMGDTEFSEEKQHEIFDMVARNAVWRGRIRFSATDGSTISMDTGFNPIYNSLGNLQRYVVIHRDVTHELHLEEQLRQSQKMEAIGQLAGGIAHDFNNLLTAIVGNINLAMMQASEPIKEFLIPAEIASHRATEMVKQILAFGRRSEIKVRPVDIAKLFEDNRTIIRNSIDRRIELSSSAHELTRQANADPNQLQQVLLNLCVNARDALLSAVAIYPERKLILFLSADDFNATEEYCRGIPDSEPGEYVRITVSDNGIGMSPDVKKRMFEPFYTTKPTSAGTGLGLATVYGIVRQHHGWIEVISQQGVGSSFRIFLPATAQLENKANANSTLELPTGTETILIVDDEDMIRNLAKNMLEPLGYNILEARDGRDGVQTYFDRREQIDLVILDYSMPYMTGGEALKLILEGDPSAKVIISSGYTTPESRDHKEFQGAKAFVPKPYSIQQMTETVRAVIDQN